MRCFYTFCFLLSLSHLAYGQFLDVPNLEKILNSLDSNMYIENLFPEDTLYKDLKISFVKKKAVHEAGNSYFNVCKIYNNSKEEISFKVRLNIPSGWKQLNNLKNSNFVLSPGETQNIPIRLSIPQVVVGGLAYVINVIATNDKKDFVGIAYVKIPKYSAWKLEHTNNKIYFNKYYNKEDLKIYLSNKGNASELINLKFKKGNKLIFSDSVNDNNYILLPPFKDTILTYSVSAVSPEIMTYDYAQNNWNDNEILVSAIGSDGVVQKKNYYFFNLDHDYFNPRNEVSSPLNVELSAINLMSGQNPFYNLLSFGQIQFIKPHEISYSINARNISSNSSTSFINNPNLFFFNINHDWNSNLRTNIGTISTGNPLLLNWGNGINSQYKIDNRSNAGINFISNRFYPDWMISSHYSSNFKSKKPENPIKYTARLSYQKNDYMFYRAIMPQFKVSFTPIKNHHISANILTSIGSFDLSQGLNQNQDTSVFGFSYGVSYSGTINDFKLSFNQINRKNNFLMFTNNGITNSKVLYQINKKSNMTLCSDFFTNTPSKINLSSTFFGQYQNQNMTRLLYNLRYNKNITFTGGPRFQNIRFRSLISSDSTISDFVNSTIGLYGATKFKISSVEYFTPNLFIGTTSFNNRLSDTINLQSANNVSFGLNYVNRNLGINASYIKGVTFFINNAFFQSEDTRVNNETLFLRANYSKDIPSKGLKVTGYLNYFFRMPSNIQNFGVSSRADFKLSRRLSGFAAVNLFTNSIVNNENGKSNSRFFNLNGGVRYSVDIPQPRIKYYDLKIVCFNDLNGDQIKTEDEPILPNIILNLKRDFENEIVKTIFHDKELVTGLSGEINVYDMPEGDYILNFSSIENLGVLYNTNGNQQKLTMYDDKTLFISYGEGYKVKGKIVIERDPNSSKGNINLKGVRVKALSTSGEIFTTLTDENGYYSLSVPSSGHYKVSINNIFGNQFYINNNDMVIQFDGFKIFNLDFEFLEGKRNINIKGNNQFNFGNK